jgi:hypothetical protein
LREAIQFESAILLEKSHGYAYRLIARVPGECGDGFTLPEEGLLIGRLRGYYPLPLTPGDLEAWGRWAAKKPEHLAEIECLRARPVRRSPSRCLRRTISRASSFLASRWGEPNLARRRNALCKVALDNSRS